MNTIRKIFQTSAFFTRYELLIFILSRYAHLTNNSIAKNSSKFDASAIEGNMWSDDEFAEYLKVSILLKNRFYYLFQSSTRMLWEEMCSETLLKQA